MTGYKRMCLIYCLLICMTLCGCSTVMGEDTVINEVEQETSQHLAYGKVLWDAYQRGILPDGSPLDYIGMEAAENNRFAIIDIDGDGQEELLLCWDYASMAGSVEFVFGYNDGEIHTELQKFPRLTFYDNGIVEGGWSHNQGLAGEFWPYDIFRYDAERDVYQSYGSIDAWDRSVLDVNYKGEPFPENIDIDGDGIVYYFFPADWDGHVEEIPLIDGAEYEEWRNDYLNGAEEISIDFQQLTEENIAALGYPKPDIQLPQPVG